MSKKPLCSLIKCLREIIGLFDLIAVGNILDDVTFKFTEVFPQ